MVENRLYRRRKPGGKFNLPLHIVKYTMNTSFWSLQRHLLSLAKP